MAEPVKLKEYFGSNLAALLAEKIVQVEPRFEKKPFLRSVNKTLGDLELKARVNLIAQELKNHLMAGRDYPEALRILLQILGPENPNETGMFKTGYWLMPVAKFVELNEKMSILQSAKRLGSVNGNSTTRTALISSHFK